jgi:hypothetical protein
MNLEKTRLGGRRGNKCQDEVREVGRLVCGKTGRKGSIAGRNGRSF